MGNRAVIQMQDEDTGIYLHWNGGRDSIEPLLEVAREYGLRGDDYGIARLIQIIGNTFDGTLGMGAASPEHLDRDNGDNGTYVIDENFKIVNRLFQRYPEQDNHSFDGMKEHIKKANDRFFKTPAADIDRVTKIIDVESIQ